MIWYYAVCYFYNWWWFFFQTCRKYYMHFYIYNSLVVFFFYYHCQKYFIIFNNLFYLFNDILLLNIIKNKLHQPYFLCQIAFKKTRIIRVLILIYIRSFVWFFVELVCDIISNMMMCLISINSIYLFIF